jgi:ribosomal protein S18 acetylase RimI-like enzyme
MPISREAFIAHLKSFQQYFLVAESHDSGVVGYAHGSVQVAQGVPVIPAQEPYLEIENIYVKPDCRNRHIGGRLLERLLAVAEHSGIQRFLVSSNSKNMAQILNFYHRYGFTAWYVHMVK